MWPVIKSSAVIGWNILSSMNAVHNFNQLQLQQDQHINKRHCLIKLALKCKKVQCDELILENPNSVFSWNIYKLLQAVKYMHPLMSFKWLLSKVPGNMTKWTKKKYL